MNMDATRLFQTGYSNLDTPAAAAGVYCIHRYVEEEIVHYIFRFVVISLPRLFVVDTTSCQAERNMSALKLVVSDLRGKLGASKVDKILCFSVSTGT